MKKKYTLIFFILSLLFTGCSNVEEELNLRIAEEFKKYNFEYASADTIYESTYKSDYWNYLSNKYEKMFYEAAVNADFSDNIQKHIYFFYGEEANNYSRIECVKGIQYARLDHPELELMNMNFYDGFKQTSDKGCSYQIVSYYSKEYDEYVVKLNEINSEIKDLVYEVNNTQDIVKKHYLIFNWITSNVNYIESGEEIGNVDFYNNEYILAGMKTYSTQNIYGAIVNKSAVCDGIADAYKYICNICNLECIIVDGYISDASKQMYHAWNLVKVNNTWYLVDATWNLGKDSSNYFMVKDLKKGERTPFNIGHDLPGYDDEISNQMTFEEITETKISNAEKEIIFELVDENHSMHVKNDTIYTSFSSLGLKKFIEGKEKVSNDVIIKTNCEITSIEYYDYNETLIEVIEETNNLDIVFPEYLDDNYVCSMYVFFSIDGQTYKVKFKKGSV